MSVTAGSERPGKGAADVGRSDHLLNHTSGICPEATGACLASTNTTFRYNGRTTTQAGLTVRTGRRVASGRGRPGESEHTPRRKTANRRDDGSDESVTKPKRRRS